MTTVHPDRAMEYLEFVAERHRVWERRQAGSPPPWTDDPRIAGWKYTNVFRVLDPGSQFVFTLLGDRPAPLDALVRVFLYRWTNHPDFWQWLLDETGRLPGIKDLRGGEDSALADRMVQARAEGVKVFSAAYMTNPAPREITGYDKGRMIVKVAERTFVKPFWEAFQAAESTRERVEVLAKPPRMGPFLALQMLTDLDYAGYYIDDETYIASGPGSRLGAAYLTATDRGPKPPLGSMAVLEKRTVEAIHWAHGALRREPSAPTLTLPDGRLHHPSLMDVQNTLCEYGKYRRYADRAAKRTFKPSRETLPPPVLPEHW